MYKPVTLFLFVLLLNNIHAQSPHYVELTSDAYKLYEDKKFDQSWEYYSRAFKIDSTYAGDLYNGACSAALAGKIDLATKTLRKAIQNGYIDKGHMLADPDLDSLRGLPEWSELLAEVEISKKQYRTDDSLLKELKGYLERNKPDSLRLLLSDSFKLRVAETELKSKVNTLFNLINQTPDKKFKTLEQNSNSSSNMQIINGRMKETREFTYKYMPPFYGNYVNHLFLKNIGFSVVIEISKIKNDWYLNNLDVDSNYLSRDYDPVAFLKDVINGKDTCFVQYRIITSNKSLTGNAVVVSNKNNYLRLKNPQFMKMDEFVKPVEGNKNLFSISFYRKCPDSNFFWSFESFKALELIFFDDGSNQCLISNGERYAFYKLDDTAPLKELIYNEIKNVK
jgi:hypothetical protein